MTSSHYQAPIPALWQGRPDSLSNERFFQIIEFLDLSQKPLNCPQDTTVIIGFCCDEGVKRNLGQLGAKQGPNEIRKTLAKLPIHRAIKLLDVGNVCCDDSDLESAQTALAKIISHCHKQGLKTLILGGGHEIAWGHYQGLTTHYDKLGIINFDAHFDLRPLSDNGQGSSGTPFNQIANYCHQKEKAFNYCCLGIQKIANTKSLFEKANTLHVNYLNSAQMNEQSFAWQCAFLDDFLLNVDSIYLTICLDVFAECFAPGVSAPQATGITPWQALPLLKYIIQSQKVVSFDIAELSPPLDEKHKTARLAANLIAELIS